MQMIIISLMAGILLGKFLLPPGHQALISRLTLGGVMALLFIMGAQIGASEEVLQSLPRLGAQALILAAICTLGSVIFSIPLGRGKQ